MKPSTWLSVQASVFSMNWPCMWRTIILVIRPLRKDIHRSACCRGRRSSNQTDLMVVRVGVVIERTLRRALLTLY